MADLSEDRLEEYLQFAIRLAKEVCLGVDVRNACKLILLAHSRVA